MPKKSLKSTQEEQDEAFFGSTRTSNYADDHKLAMELQDVYLKRDRSSIKREKARQEKQDMEFAARLQNEGSTGNTISNFDFDDERRKRQEEEDAKLAREIQEGESSSATSRTRRGVNQQRLPTTARSNNRNRLSGIHDHHTINALIPKCANCGKIVMNPVHAMGNLYHRECFRCMACHGVIEANERFAVTTGEDEQSHPLHRHCYADLYGLKCSVCRNTIHGDSNGRVSYIKHPFFEEVMCSSHSQERKCTGCHRFEPIGSDHGFADLGDADRRACYSCCRSIIVDSDDAKPLWRRIIRYFERSLKLPIYSGMAEIPILIVPHDALNSQSQNSNHQGSSQIMTRGLCLSEHQIGMNLMLPRLRFNRNSGSFLPSDAESRGHTYFRIPDATKRNHQTNVTAILCLTGLPSDLSASILAHEATHAWIKLHPNFDPSIPIPPQVEEGCCQLVAMLFLNDGLDEPSSYDGDGSGPSDKKLRQYFKFSIETDTNEIYGEGYRKAAKTYAQIGIEALLSHVVNYRDFPNI